ncbi:hypothetical protein EBL89_05325 [Cereibacter sphaeroides]|nr:hypothetical protein EBL89_05325 [Cereibacter sphaeroides]AZB58980.1 hypothetical protein EBL88_05065 [Cereibacter sphaeroides]
MFFMRSCMSMLLIDLQAACAVLWVRCRKCRRCVQMSGRSLVRDYGQGVMLVDLVRRLRCSKCALPAYAAIMLKPAEEASRKLWRGDRRARASMRPRSIGRTGLELAGEGMTGDA